MTALRSVSSGASGCDGPMRWSVWLLRRIWPLPGVAPKSRSPSRGAAGCCRCGLSPFDVTRHRVFFGRAEEVKQLVELLRSEAERARGTALLVVGPSGCGKSSLVRAGPGRAGLGWCR